MKTMFRPHLMALSLGLMAAAEAQTSTGTAPTGDVPSTNAEGAAPEKKARAPKNPENTLNIINGRLPLPLVFMIRFDKLGALSTGDAAKAFGTSVGKVFDIKKGRNFGYIDASYKPSAEEITAAKAWCESGKTAKGQSLTEAGGKPAEILAALNGLGVATPEEVAARNWKIREVGAKAATGEAPTATATGDKNDAAKGAEKPAGAKLF